MKTEIYHIDSNNIDYKALDKAGEIIREGGIVAFPTETVYGLGGDALNEDSSGKIYAAKGRPSDNPLIVHIANPEDVYNIANDISDKARILMDNFWPGPITMIFSKKDIVPGKTTGGLDTVAIRCPDDPVARAFINAAKRYIAAPSANISGKPSPTSGEYVVQDMDSRVDAILFGNDSRIGLESTIVDMTVEPPMILRPGYITREMLEDVIGEVASDQTILSDKSEVAPKAPGMKYRHYAPKGSLQIVEGEKDAVISYINERIECDKAAGLKTGVIATNDTLNRYVADEVFCAGNTLDKEEIAHNLFGILRKFDDTGVERIYSESFGIDGLSAAVMNRLLKAAGHNVVKL